MTVAAWFVRGWLFSSSKDADGNSEGRRRHRPTPSPVDQEARALHFIAGVPASDLLTELRKGNRTALATIYTALRPSLWRLAMILVRSESTADEIVQNVFLSLWGRRTALAPDDDIQAYLNTAVRNAARNLHRDANVRARLDTAVSQQLRDVPALGQQSVLPDAAAEAEEFQAAYRHALTLLTDREQVALQLRWETDATFEAIGQVLGLSKVGARTVVLRAEAKVRALLEKYRT